MGDGIDELVKNMKAQAKKQVPTQTVWVTVDAVDWDAKTMDCTGIADELEYYDVLLGLGSEFKKPTVGSKCIIALLANNDAAAHLIHAEEVEELIWTDSTGFKVRLNDGLLTLNGNGYSIVKAQELQQVMDMNKQYMQVMEQVINTPVNEPGFSMPSVFQATLAAALASVQWGDHSDINNDEVKHG